MATLKHTIQGLVGVALIVWGCEYLPRLANVTLVRSWVGPFMIGGGTLLAWRACAQVRRLAVPLGILLLGFAGLWAWNLHFWYDPARVPTGMRPGIALLASPTILILLGCAFCIFFRYWSPSNALPANTPGTPPVSQLEPVDDGQTSVSPNRISRTTAGYRLFLLGCSVVVAIAAAWLVGAEHVEERTRVFLIVLPLGCVATGLISEATLQHFLSRSK
jgi:hypothetical protein